MMQTGPHSLRILFLADELKSITNGGSERQVLQLMELLRTSGHTVHLAVFRGSEWLRGEYEHASLYFSDINSAFSPKGLYALCKLARRMREEKYDVVQTMFWEANLIGPPLARLAGIPIILGSRRNLNYWMSSPIASLQSISNRFTTRLVANSQAVRQVVSEQERTPLDKIDVIYNGVDVNHFRVDYERGREIRRRFGVSESAILVGNISTFRPVKGLDVFVRAAELVIKDRPETRFIIVGDGPTYPDIRALAAGLNIESKCLFAQAQRDVRPFLSALDVAVLSSHSEGLSNSLLEYMATGLPIVATSVGGNRETLGDTGALVPPNDPAALAQAIGELVGDPVRRQAAGRNARKRVQEFFSLETAQKHLHEYVTNIVANRGRRTFITAAEATANRN